MNPESSFSHHLENQGKLPSAIACAHGEDLVAPHGTTIVALRHANGVVMAGDRRATMGNIIAQRDIQKVFPADQYSLIGIAGSAGIAIELVRLFQVELEHYEKIEGTPLSLNGKANRLSSMLRSNLGLAMQGMAVVPLFAGFDSTEKTGRIFSYDITLVGPFFIDSIYLQIIVLVIFIFRVFSRFALHHLLLNLCNLLHHHRRCLNCHRFQHFCLHQVHKYTLL